MNFWSSHTQNSGQSTLTRWAEQVDMTSLKPGREKTCSSNTRTSTAAGDALPLPVLIKAATRPRQTLHPWDAVVALWTKFKRRLSTVQATSSSSAIDESAESHVVEIPDGPIRNDDDVVDEVIVDRAWLEDFTSSATQSDPVGSPEKSGGSHHGGRSASDHESLRGLEGVGGVFSIGVLLRWRIWPAVVKFFSLSFADSKSEDNYAQETWFIKKSLACWASVWLILNWVLGCIFARPIYQVFDQIVYYGIAPILTLPIIIMVMYDWPRDRSNVYQVFITFSIWLWPFYSVLFIYLCPFYPQSPHVHLSCQNRDFLGTFYYTTALQAIALFGLKLNRLPAAIGASTFFVMACALMIPLRKTWVRSMINFFLFHSFLLYVHYMRENSERRLYTLRDQLKVQYKATQKAQVNERKAADSKRRLTSYVRVPLNTALLAVQNMGASGTIAKEQEIEFSALEGSLSMMSKVLNDMLDFNRMDSGKFELLSAPYGFHHVMRSLFVPLRLTTNARGLEFETELDPRIDQIARRTAYEAMGKSEETIHKHMSEHPDVDGIVVGDELRLRQIVTNLASNACKFTPAGGKLAVKTKLVLPANVSSAITCSVASPANEGPKFSEHPPLSISHLSQHNNEDKAPGLEYVVVRIEVTDTGCGIKPRDVVQNKLFSAFNQTEQGRQQGGKGTGLGLALVRQIVKLSGGRLGVRSKVNEGSTFWVELPLGVGVKTLANYNCPASGSTCSDQVSISMKNKDVIPVSLEGSSMTMAAGAVTAFNASQATKDFGRSNSAMQGLMEQGGRVELVLQRHGSCSPVFTGSDSASSFERLPERSDQKDDAGQSSSTPQSRSIKRRPTYVPMPSPHSFSIDPQPTSASNVSKVSDPLAQFDATYTRGSPSSITPPMVMEPGLPVLVVDDDQVTRSLMTRLLTRLGCHVSTAENGEVALEMILGPAGLNALTHSTDASGDSGPILEPEPGYEDEDKYAIVFLDNQMPVLSGLQAVQKLRSYGRTNFIVGVTGNALPDDQQEFLEAGVDRVLTKPVHERSLRDMLVIADERRKNSSCDTSP
ncbi:Signal transduction histidine-protein kinase BarA [Termitomyces sp. T112]|nr:Signal transduction histidine-protein kinase BarA [Termitomyces sp. T112]